MDDQFYRKLQPEQLLNKIARSAAKNKKRTVLIVLVFIVLLYVVFDNKGVLTRFRLEQQHREWMDQLKRDSLETLRLREQMKAIESSNDTLERIARERYGLAKQGETVYQVRKQSADSSK